jgi:hypothetical protein
MSKLLLTGTALVAIAIAAPVYAKGKGGGGAANSRAISELMGKFKWGMSPEEVTKVIGEGITAKYAELRKAEPDAYKQDVLRKQGDEEIQKIKESLVKFDGQKTGWDVSIVDKEFGHRNNESMMVQWEKDQRRFLFFYHGKLYKQFIAFDASHPVFKGKSFDDFAQIIQGRYGQAQMKFAKKRTSDDQELDHLEWPVSNDYLLHAIDLSSFYGNFCLMVAQNSVNLQAAKGRAEKNPKAPGSHALVDAVTKPDKGAADANENIVDQITGTKK